MNQLSGTICFLDFDHMLFDTDRFFHVDVKSAFRELGVDVPLWERTYIPACLAGYTLEKHAQAMYEASGGAVPLDAMRRIIETRFSDLARYLFEDVVPFLLAVRDLGADLAILSFGNPDWQRYKVRAAGIEPFFRFFCFTDRENSKIDVMRSRAGSYRASAFFDNHPNELDCARDLDETIRTFLINRVPSPEVLRSLPENSFLEARRYNLITPRHHHLPCTNLCDAIHFLGSL